MDNNYPPQNQPYPPQPYGYPPVNNTKSATTAGLLGLFLGQIGAHNWYLGEKQKGLIHSIIFGACVLIFIVIDFIIPATSWRFALWLISGGFWIIPLIGVVWAANAIWGLVEGIIILANGDAGLARRGFAVAAPVAPAPAPYPPQGQPYPPQGQPYQPQPYPSQPYPPQPYAPQPYPESYGEPHHNNSHEPHRGDEHHEHHKEHRDAE